MKFRAFDLEGPLEILPRKIEDERGYFCETFRQSIFVEKVGPVAFVQDNESLNVAAGTIRGIHFQIDPSAQGKLIHCTAGRILDFAVDLRANSPAYGRWIGVELSAALGNRLWIPAGFGHAYCTLEPNSIVSYRVTAYYDAAADKGVAWDDPDIAIDWPTIADPSTLSPKDLQQPSLADLPSYFSKAAYSCG